MVEKQKNQSLIYIGIILLVIILIIVILILKNKGYFSTLGTSINNSLSSIKQTVSSGMSKVSGKLFKSSNQNNIGQTQLITRGGRR
jgi:Sec-independent protein translocase protein TatA